MFSDRPWRVLLVEDDEDDYFLTHALLDDFQGHPFELAWVQNAPAAFKRLEAEAPDVVLIDYALGAESGVDVIRQAISRGCPAPFILLTGQGDYDVDLKAMQAGAVDFLPKTGLTPYALERSIRYAIERNATERALRQAREELERRVEERTQELQERSHQLSAANSLLERVFTGLHLQIAYLDRQFNFLRVNRNYAEANNHPPEYFVGKNHFELFPDPQATQIFETVVETGETYLAFARPFVHPESNGEGVTYWDWSLQPVFEPDGIVGGLVLSLLDVTERRKAALELREREELIQAIITGAPMILAALDREGKFTLVEGRGLESLGLTPAELIGYSIFKMVAATPEVEGYLDRALAGEEVSAVVKAANGVSFYTRFLPQCEPQGRVTGIISVSTDITERIQAEAQLAYQAGLLERVNDAIIATDENFTITSWNRTAEVIYGYTAKEMLGRGSYRWLWGEIEGSESDRALETLQNAGQYQGEALHYRKDGQLIYVDFKTTALRSPAGQVTGYVSVNRNISERKKIQAELAEVQRSLIESTEAERQHIARELHDGPMQELYALAYEIESLRTMANGSVSGALIDSLQSKLRQVNQALRATATELRPPTLAPFGLEKAIRSHAERFSQEHPELHVSLALDADGQALPERVRLALFRIYQQALTNVVRHAGASRVAVRLEINPERVVMEIQDDGLGFSVPERWVELARGGHLGLVGAQERANAVGGSVEVLSEPGKGALIRVTAPRAPAD